MEEVTVEGVPKPVGADPPKAVVAPPKEGTDAEEEGTLEVAIVVDPDADAPPNAGACVKAEELVEGAERRLDEDGTLPKDGF